MEDVLVHINGRMTTDKQGSLNPCCGGRCSSTWYSLLLGATLSVLILVVVEDVLVRIYCKLLQWEDKMS